MRIAFAVIAAVVLAGCANGTLSKRYTQSNNQYANYTPAQLQALYDQHKNYCWAVARNQAPMPSIANGMTTSTTNGYVGNTPFSGNTTTSNQMAKNVEIGWKSAQAAGDQKAIKEHCMGQLGWVFSHYERR
ncbi:hypothetical protein FCL40_17140 [Ferrimonas sediminicola]|uniref:Lipoprotein n=1 Tax=Ferrimonas sediminicola TaxID=2569538 RepID=A0A4U1B8E7_9GAMM|nr:hypothetical protein [Ferrimonas sediminicola]TKB46781.1 hypothetical protein FCL40_17140 [Ferrimonas sediminicola]